MALSPETAREHIRTWTERLRSHPRQANWPAHLFHSADLSNAVEVLARGRLLCRRGLQEIPCDVANQGALWNNPSAHEYVRLYFRPRNNFHLKTEGIKCLGDPYRQDPAGLRGPYPFRDFGCRLSAGFDNPGPSA